MPARFSTSFVRILAAAVLVATWGAAGPLAGVADVRALRAGGSVPAVQADTRTVYVAVRDRNGMITDLQAPDFEVKAGGRKLEVVSAAPAQAPLRIALLVSDAGTGGFQQGLANFMQRLLGHAEFALVSVIVQPEMIQDYSSEGGVLSAALRRLGPRGRQRGAQLMEAIHDAAKHVRRDGTRPAIVVARVGAEDATSLSADDVRAQLRQSGAILYVVSTVGAQRPSPSQARPGISTEQAQMRDDEATSGAMNLAQVLGDGARESGGRHDQVISTTLVPAFEQVADELRHQYALTCALPDGVKPGDKLSVSVKRKGAKVLGPARLGN